MSSVLVIVKYREDGSEDPSVSFVDVGRPGAMPDSKPEPELDLAAIKLILEKVLAGDGWIVKIWNVTTTRQERIWPPVQGQRD